MTENPPWRGSPAAGFKSPAGATSPIDINNARRIAIKNATETYISLHSFFCLPNKRKNQRKIHLRCFSISSEIAKKLRASKTSFAVQSKVSALFPIFYQILREKQRGHFFLSRRIFKTARRCYQSH